MISDFRSDKLGDNRQAFLLPVSQAAKLHSLVTRFEKRFSSARRAPATTSIEDDVRVLWKFVHAAFEFVHWNIDGAWDGTAFLDLLRLAHVDDDRFLVRIDFLF